MEKILIVMPYLSKGAQGKEIIYAVEGWKQHFKEDCHIIIVGDYDKNVQEVFDRAKQGEPDISYIECPRITPVEGQYICHLDHVNKFRTVRKNFPDSTGFIYACDDMYAVKDFRLADVQAPKVKSFAMTGSLDSKGWKHDLAKTRALCEREGLDVWNWICHLPVWYEWDKLFAIYDKYDCDHQSYVVENIYFNTYSSECYPKVLDIECDNLTYPVYDNSRETVDQMHKALDQKTWITNTPEGWSADLECLLQIHYKY